LVTVQGDSLTRNDPKIKALQTFFAVSSAWNLEVTRHIRDIGSAEIFIWKRCAYIIREVYSQDEFDKDKLSVLKFIRDVYLDSQASRYDASMLEALREADNMADFKSRISAEDADQAVFHFRQVQSTSLAYFTRMKKYAFCPIVSPSAIEILRLLDEIPALFDASLNWLMISGMIKLYRPSWTVDEKSFKDFIKEAETYRSKTSTDDEKDSALNKLRLLTCDKLSFNFVLPSSKRNECIIQKAVDLALKSEDVEEDINTVVAVSFKSEVEKEDVKIADNPTLNSKDAVELDDNFPNDINKKPRSHQCGTDAVSKLGDKRTREDNNDDNAGTSDVGIDANSFEDAVSDVDVDAKSCEDTFSGVRVRANSYDAGVADAVADDDSDNCNDDDDVDDDDDDSAIGGSRKSGYVPKKPLKANSKAYRKPKSTMDMDELELYKSNNMLFRAEYVSRIEERLGMHLHPDMIKPKGRKKKSRSLDSLYLLVNYNLGAIKIGITVMDDMELLSRFV
jgi:hypothetical protein